MRHEFNGDAGAQAGRMLAWLEDYAVPAEKCEIIIDGDGAPDPLDLNTTVMLTIGNKAEIIVITAVKEVEKKAFVDWTLSGTLVTSGEGDQDLGDGPNDPQTLAQIMCQASVFMLEYLEELDIDDGDGDDEDDEPEPEKPQGDKTAKTVKSKRVEKGEPVGVA